MAFRVSVGGACKIRIDILVLDYILMLSLRRSIAMSREQYYQRFIYKLVFVGLFVVGMGGLVGLFI
jgi:hypothetical protein